VNLARARPSSGSNTCVGNRPYQSSPYNIIRLRIRIGLFFTQYSNDFRIFNKCIFLCRTTRGPSLPNVNEQRSYFLRKVQYTTIRIICYLSNSYWENVHRTIKVWTIVTISNYKHKKNTRLVVIHGKYRPTPLIYLNLNVSRDNEIVSVQRSAFICAP